MDAAMLGSMPPWAAVATLIVAAMAVTPSWPLPLRRSLRARHQPCSILIAVAIGAACDFLTPKDHQCNTLAMGPGGYKFWDYWKLGLPLSVLVVATATPLILLVWSTPA